MDQEQHPTPTSEKLLWDAGTVALSYMSFFSCAIWLLLLLQAYVRRQLCGGNELLREKVVNFVQIAITYILLLFPKTNSSLLFNLKGHLKAELLILE